MFRTRITTYCCSLSQALRDMPAVPRERLEAACEKLTMSRGPVHEAFAAALR